MSVNKAEIVYLLLLHRGITLLLGPGLITDVSWIFLDVCYFVHITVSSSVEQLWYSLLRRLSFRLDFGFRFDDFNLIRQGFLLAIDTFGISHILPILGLPFLLVLRCPFSSQSQGRSAFFANLTEVISLESSGICSNATINLISLYLYPLTYCLTKTLDWSVGLDQGYPSIEVHWIFFLKGNCSKA